MSHQRWKLTLSYSGDGFSGWQSQVHGHGVQDHLERALTGLAGQPLRIHGAGRTDAGVHASGQCAHFDAPAHLENLDGGNWRDALNTRLPQNLRVLHAKAVPADFHARFSSIGKLYRYRIRFGPVLPPPLAGVCWHRRLSFDTEEMRWLSRWLIGQHDFRRLSANRRGGLQPTTTVRIVRDIRISTPHPDEVQIDIPGDGFLYKMVRMIVGSLVAVVEGKKQPSWLVNLVRDPANPQKPHFCAPAHGLCLVRVDYPAV